MSQKHRLLFLVYHGTGHFNACFHASKILRDKFDIYFAGVPFFQAYVTAQGFNYIPLTSLPFGTSLEQWRNEVTKNKPVYINTIKDRWRNTLYKQRSTEFLAVLDRIHPTHILLDAQQSSDFIVLHPEILRRRIKIALVHTMLPLRLQKGIPPMDSLALPGDRAKIARAHRITHWRKFKKRAIQFFKYGISDQRIIKRNFVRNHIPGKYLDHSLSSFQFTINGIPEIIFSPKEFEFNKIIDENRQHFVGTFVDHSRIENAEQEFLMQCHEIFGLIEVKKLKLIYCAFGSLSSQYQANLIALVERIITATADLPCFVLIAINVDRAMIPSANSPHVHVFKQLPQMEILEHADVFINHGGLNSIKEGIDATVPMLVFPIERKTDTCGNSSRVIYHKIGLRGDVIGDSVDDIKQKITTLLSDSTFKSNFDLFKCDQKQKDEEFVSLILSLKPLED